MKKRKIKLNGTQFTLGKKYKDSLLGNEGIATAGVAYLTGCDQIMLKWNDTTGRPVEIWVDVTGIEKVKVKKIKGGPGPCIPQRTQ